MTNHGPLDQEAEKSGIDSENESASLSRGGRLTLIIKVSSVALGFAAHVLLARLLAAADYGVYAFAVTTLNFLVIGAVAGADSVATRFVAQYRNSPLLLSQFLRWLNLRALILSLFFMLLAIFAIQLIRVRDQRLIWPVTQLICLALPLQVFALLRQGILRGRKHPVLSVVPEGLVRPALTLILVGVIAGSGVLGTFNVYQATGIFVAVTAAALVSGHALLRRKLKPERLVDPKPNNPEALREWRSMATASLFTAMAMSIHSQCDIWMLGILVESSHVGAYAAATRFATFVIFGINAINTALGPMIAEATDDRERLQRLATRAVSFSFAMGISVALVLLAFPDSLLGIFGQGFEAAALPLRILVAGNIINIACGSVGVLLSMTGHHHEFVKVLLGSMLLNVCLNLGLIPWFGTTGAAIATAVSVAGWNFLGVILVRKRLKIRPALGGWF